MGGGAEVRIFSRQQQMGLSPRGRRSRNNNIRKVEEEGSISAWAEEPVEKMTGNISGGVYLRVGGGAQGCSGRGSGL